MGTEHRAEYERPADKEHRGGDERAVEQHQRARDRTCPHHREGEQRRDHQRHFGEETEVGERWERDLSADADLVVVPDRLAEAPGEGRDGDEPPETAQRRVAAARGPEAGSGREPRCDALDDVVVVGGDGSATELQVDPGDREHDERRSSTGHEQTAVLQPERGRRVLRGGGVLGHRGRRISCRHSRIPARSGEVFAPDLARYTGARRP